MKGSVVMEAFYCSVQSTFSNKSLYPYRLKNGLYLLQLIYGYLDFSLYCG